MQIRLQVHNKHGYPRSGITGKRPAERLSERAIRLWTGNYADKTTGAATESASVGPKRGSCRLFLVQQLAFRRTAARRTSINTLAGPVSCCGRTHPVCRSGFKYTKNADIPVFLPGITCKRPAERLSECAIRLWTGNHADKTTGAGKHLHWAKKALCRPVRMPIAVHRGMTKAIKEADCPVLKSCRAG